MDRRQIISMIGGAIAAASTGRSASLDAAAKIPRIGIIDNGPDWDAFRQELHDLNYTEGHTVEFEYRRADGMPERLAAAARELTQIPVDVIRSMARLPLRLRNKPANPFPLSSSGSAIRQPPGW
jgi:putative tryptophan/tyrosine transport system substrate-binding protein